MTNSAESFRKSLWDFAILFGVGTLVTAHAKAWESVIYWLYVLGYVAIGLYDEFRKKGAKGDDNGEDTNEGGAGGTKPGE